MAEDSARAFLLRRRSTPVRMLRAPAPDREVLRAILTAGVRVPDHGKLEPWRFVVLERPALVRLVGEVEARGAELGLEPEGIAKAARDYNDSPLAVAVIAAPRPSEKIPEIEQVLSAGAVCLSVLNAALAHGWGACWLTGWPVHDRAFAERALGVGAGEFVAGMIHIGSTDTPPPDRPRPDIDAITRWSGP